MPGEGGRFFVLDGVDGCGKTTQAERLVRALRDTTRRDVLHLREPGGTPLGERIREVLLSREFELGAAVETLLFAASRRQMLEERVAPALASGAHVVCERFHPATFAYQAVAGGLDEGEVLALLENWAGSPAPDLCIVLELDVALAGARRGAAGDRIEDKGESFQHRVAEGMKRYAERARNVVLLEGSGTEDEVFERIRREVERVL